MNDDLENDHLEDRDLAVPHVSETLRDIVAGLTEAYAADAPVPIGQRHPVIRRGDRDEIAPMLRSLIWHRDRGRCQMCGRSDVIMELDHIVPWSAGGPDVSTNLRLLCGPCNERRSNFQTLELERPSAVTPICDRCMKIEGDGWYRRFTHPDAVHHPAFCGTCKRPSTVTDPARLL